MAAGSEAVHFVGDGELQNSWRYFARPSRIKILHLKFWPLGFDVV